MRETVLVLQPKDNVGTVLVHLDQGTKLTAERGNQILNIRTQEPIAFGHKIALLAIGTGEPVFKYGEVIGRATTNIAAGAHVHSHNVESQRGRGDLASSSIGRQVG